MVVETVGSVTIYGGNGFVGSAITRALVERGIRCTVVSRSGERNGYLRELPRTQHALITWREGDAAVPNTELLNATDTVVCAIGAPPLPTFTKAAFDKQVFANGTTNANLIDAACTAGVKRLVLVGADIPRLLRFNKFAYYVGKQMAEASATRFAAASTTEFAAVLQPSLVYGTRYTGRGMALPLGLALGPIATLHLMLPKFIGDLLPPPFVDVDDLGWAAAELISSSRKTATTLQYVASRALAQRTLESH